MHIKKKIELRNAFKGFIREFFKNHDYTEVDTPILVRSPGTEVHLDYFHTEWVDHSLKSHSLYLRSSPELHMKQLLSEDFEGIFQIAQCFRNNGELSEWHRPEFTMIEWYKKNISYFDFMEQTEAFIVYLLEAMKKKFPSDIKFSFLEKAKKISLLEAFKEFAGIDLVDNDPDLAKKACAGGLVSPKISDDFETAFFKILIEKIEPSMQKIPLCVLYDYPASQSALALVEEGVARRFEFYIEGVEISNAFVELLNAKDNLDRILESNRFRKNLGKQEVPVDDEFIAYLKQDIPPTCGNALGFDRLLSVFCGAKNIEPSSCFLKMKPFV